MTLNLLRSSPSFAARVQGRRAEPDGRAGELTAAMKTADDLELLRAVADQDRSAFEDLYRRYYRRVCGYVLRVARRPEMVEEVVNDTLFTVWQSAGRFDGRSRVSTWVLGIAYRKTLKALSRRDARTSSLEESGVPDPLVDPAAERQVARHELRGSLTRALAELSADQRAVLELAYFHDLSCAEIAEIVDCPVNTVKTRMFHARRKLRDRLPELGIHGAEAV
jgi:RNA polymerase sigma-70 factor (ECF subfamily)